MKIIAILLFMSFFVSFADSMVLLNPLIFMQDATNEPAKDETTTTIETTTEAQTQDLNCWRAQKIPWMQFFCKVAREVQAKESIYLNHG